jgi:NAD-dependent dihydropyrimidine dehydrogenase PreA subunit
MKMRYLKNTVSLSIDVELCIGCAMCIAVCPHDVYAMDGKKAKIQDRDACMECGACRSNCPADAIDVEAGTGGVFPVLEEMMRKDGDRRKRGTV